MTGLEWFFAILSAVLIFSGLYVRILEERAAEAGRPLQRRRAGRVVSVTDVLFTQS